VGIQSPHPLGPPLLTGEGEKGKEGRKPLSRLLPFSGIDVTLLWGTGVGFFTGECAARGAKPPLKYFPPLKQSIYRAQLSNLFERGIKGVSRIYPGMKKRDLHTS
jgi:hypothetical protein